MVLNEEKVLKLAENAVVDSEMNGGEFDRLFGFLNARERAEALDILTSNGIRVTDRSADAAQPSNEELCRRLALGDAQALDLICRKNEGLVRRCAAMFYRYFRNDMEMDDLVEMGYRGLITAARRYDRTRGTAFSTYAVYWIKQSIRREVQECGHRVRIPVHIQEGIALMNRVSAQLTGEGVTRDELFPALSRRTGMSTEKLTDLMEIRDNFLCGTSLDTPLGDDSDTVLGDMLPSCAQESVEDVVADRLSMGRLGSCMDRLTPRERYVISHRFGLGGGDAATLEQVSRELSITRERVRQLQEQALSKLRAMMDSPCPISA